MLDKLKYAKKVVGIKQLRRAIRSSTVTTVFLALDADPDLTGPIRAECEQTGLPVEEVPTMRELGRACGIEVGAAAAAIVR